MALNLQASDFELLGVPEQFAQNPAELDAQWKRLLREAHPDRFAAQGATAQRLSMQWSVRINEAHQRLKDPLKRAAHLCERWGAAVEAERNTAMPPEFLMQQMAWREELDDAGTDTQALDDLLARTREARTHLMAELGLALDGDAAMPREQRAQQAVGQVRAFMFIERFSAEVSQRLAHLDA